MFGPRCERVAAYSKEEGEARGMVVVWDVGRGEPVPLRHDGRPAHREPVTDVGFAADGRVVTTGQDDEVVVWTPTGGKWAAEVLGVEPGKERVGHRADATGAAFDAGGNRVVSAGRDGSTIVWGREPGGRYTARLALRAGDRSREVVQAVFAGDRLVATASADNVVRVWDTKAAASSGRLVASAPFPMTVRHVRWRSDPAGLGAVLGVGRVGESSNPTAVPDPRPWATRFTAAEFPLTRLADATPVLALVQGAEVVAARKDLEDDPTQLVGLPPGEAFAILPAAAPPPVPNEAEWHRWEAVRCEAAANWAGARWHLDRLLKESPAGRPDLFARRAAVLAHLGEWEPAEADYARAGEGNPDVLRPLAQMRFRRAEAEKNAEKKRELFGKAAEAYDRLSRLGRADPHDGLRLVRAQLDAGTPAAAVESCTRLLADGFQPVELTGRFRPDVKALRAEAHGKLTPEQPQAAFADYTAAAREFQQSGLLPNAANALDRALGLKNLASLDKQDVAKASTDYADIQMQRRLFHEAERVYRGVIGPRVTAPPPAVEFHAATAAVAFGYFTTAPPALAQLEREGPPGYRLKALTGLAAVHLHRGEDDLFHQACNRLFDLKGVPPADHTPTRAAAAWVSSLSPRQPKGRREEAQELARQVADDPQPGTHRLTLGAVLARSGKTEEAVDILSKVLAADGVGPPRAEGLYRKAAGHLFLAVAYRRAQRGGDSGRGDDAAREVEKAREAVRRLDRALDPATADADLPEDMRSVEGVAAAVWYRLELRLLLRELDPGRPE